MGRRARRRLLAVGPGLVILGSLVAACLDPAGAARDTCRSEGVGEQRCRAIVNVAASKAPAGHPPVIGVEVRLAEPADRDTLRDQQLAAIVRFSYLDGSGEEIPVFCGPRLADTAVCIETAP